MYGARPLKRAIQDKVEDFISEDIWQGFKAINDFDVEKSNTKLTEKFDSSFASNNVKQNSKEVICPHCLEMFELRD
jgi:ATP-dependent Clp protease ATP-binding subunit ClpA